MIKTLRQMKIGESGKIIEVNGQGDVKRRMIDLGIIPGVYILLKKYAPLGDPMEVRVRGYNVALRKSEAENIVVEVE